MPVTSLRKTQTRSPACVPFGDTPSLEAGAPEDMKKKMDVVITVVLVACALTTTGVVVRREFFPPSSAIAQTYQKPVFIKEWRADLDKGVRMGSADASVQLMEFADFECPFCRSFRETLKTVRNRYPTQVAVTFVHFPLPMHRFAMPAARVAECAGEQGQFPAMYDHLFDAQDSFGLKSWSEFATEAGVPDGGAFEKCIERTDPILRVAEGQQLGKDLDVQGTPTLIVNGWKLGHPPSEQELDAMVKAVLAGKSPVDGKT
jgi:protein-disulfide isomerase